MLTVFPAIYYRCFVSWCQQPGTNRLGLAVASLEGIAQDLIAVSLAASSQKAYCSSQAAFARFCQSLQMPVMPAGEQLLLLYVAHLSQRVRHGTARSYLSAIRHMHLAAGFVDPLKDAPRLELALKGLRRRKPRAGDTRLPITPLILSVLGRTLVQSGDGYDHLLLWAACCLVFFAFMRSGELVTPAGVPFNPELHLTPLDIAVDSLQNPRALRIHLKSSKTDQTRQGVDLFIGRTFNALCPVVATLRYLAVRGFDQGPLFRRQDGRPLTKQDFVARVRRTLASAGMDASQYSGHSFRIGAATMAAANGVSDATIQILGRWKSDSYARYIRSPRHTLTGISQVLTQ